MIRSITIILITFLILCHSEGIDFKLPLRTEGNKVVDSSGAVVQLACVAWTGGHQKDYVPAGLNHQSMITIINLIKKGGFNCVRLQFSLELIRYNPKVSQNVLSKEPSLIGLGGFDIYKNVVGNLTKNGVMVILDNHMSDSNWCCDQYDLNGLWFNERYSEDDFFLYWMNMANIFKDNLMVVGCDLRNEIRPSKIFESGVLSKMPLYRFPSWGSRFGNDWAKAAEKAGNGILSVNPNLLIIVQGIFHLELFDNSYPQTLKHVWKRPIKLDIPGKVVYSTHEYTWHHRYLDFSKPYLDDGPEHKRFIETMDRRWGKVAEKYPVWLGEFGTWHGTNFDTYWKWMLPYLKEKNVAGFAYWCLDGTQSTGTGRTLGAEEGYGLLNMDWSDYASQPHLKSIQALMNNPPPTQDVQ